MKYGKLGRTGLEVSKIALGCMTYGETSWVPWTLGEEEAGDHFRKALDLGINFFDTADIYSKGRSEEITGRWLREIGPRREDLVIATKVYFPMTDDPNDRGLSRKHVLASCDASLRRLGVDHIDLYQIHRFDPTVPLEESLEALDSLVRAGKVRYLGADSMAAWQFAKALFTAERSGWHRFAAMQNHYNLVYREEEREMIPLCLDQGIGILPWSPLARGVLTGSRNRSGARKTKRAETDGYSDTLYDREEDFDVVDALDRVSRRRGASPAAVALAWLLSVPGVTAPIVGTTKLAHLEEAASAVEIELTKEEIEELEGPYRPNRVRGHAQPGPRNG